MVDVVKLDMSFEEITEIAEAFRCGQKAFMNEANPYNDAFFTWDAFEEGQKGLTTAPNVYQELLLTTV